MVLTMGQEALLTLMMVASPVLGVVLVVGLLISLFQAITQINEATLTFIPKLIAAMLVHAWIDIVGLLVVRALIYSANASPAPAHRS